MVNNNGNDQTSRLTTNIIVQITLKITSYPDGHLHNNPKPISRKQFFLLRKKNDNSRPSKRVKFTPHRENELIHHLLPFHLETVTE